MAATIPNCKAYDPAFAGELAVIVRQGMQEMLVEQRDVFYYVTLMNENYAQPNLPPEAHADVIAGCYHFGHYPATSAAPAGTRVPKVTLMGSGAILTEVIKAAQLLAARGIEADVLSVTSWSELARQAQSCVVEGSATPGEAFVAAQLARTHGPIIAATDYVRAVPESIRAYLPAGRAYTTLGTDGFGRSDTRTALRQHFSVDAVSIERAALRALDADA